MCTVVSAVSGALGGAQTGLGFLQAGKANDAAERQYRQSAALANEQLTQEYESLQLGFLAGEGESSAALQQISEDLREAQAIAATRAADAGVAGQSVAAFLQEFEADAGKAIALEERNRKLRRAQLLVEKQSVFTRTRAGILGATPSPVQPPDIFRGLSGILDSVRVGLAERARADTDRSDGGSINN